MEIYHNSLFSNILLVSLIYFCWSCTVTEGAQTKLLLENVARNKPTWQSSDLYWHRSKADEAVDGDATPDHSAGTCTHTKADINPPAWWAVDLEQVMVPFYIVITGTGRSSPGAAKRLKDYNVGLTDLSPSQRLPVPGQYSVCAQVKDYPRGLSFSVNITCQAGTPPGRYLIVQFAKYPGKDGFLTLCEVEVFALPVTEVNECDYDFLNTCDQNCTDAEQGYQCSCFEGYSSTSPGKEPCTDIDECQLNNITRQYCEQDCTNVEGSYNCSCRAGFILEKNGSCLVLQKHQNHGGPIVSTLNIALIVLSTFLGILSLILTSTCIFVIKKLRSLKTQREETVEDRSRPTQTAGGVRFTEPTSNRRSPNSPPSGDLTDTNDNVDNEVYEDVTVQEYQSSIDSPTLTSDLPTTSTATDSNIEDEVKYEHLKDSEEPPALITYESIRPSANQNGNETQEGTYVNYTE